MKQSNTSFLMFVKRVELSDNHIITLPPTHRSRIHIIVAWLDSGLNPESPATNTSSQKLRCALALHDGAFVASTRKPYKSNH